MHVLQIPSDAALHVELSEDAGDWSCLPDVEGVIECAARAVANELGHETPLGLVSVALSNDANVAVLNERFRGLAKPTNVLSFPAGSGAPDGQIGDIVLAQETVEREAREQGVPFEHHVQHLVVHGILHLLGYDHLTAADAEAMEGIEIKILSKLGVANPYTEAPEAGTSE